MITVFKEIGSLGFSVEGGLDSTLGDIPIRIKKIFTGELALPSFWRQIFRGLFLLLSSKNFNFSLPKKIASVFQKF